MYIKLKDKYIIQKSPVSPMLIDIDEETHAQISNLECSLIGFLDGTKTYEEIYSILTSLETISAAEKNKIQKSLDQFLEKFDDAIEYGPSKSKRNEIFYGDSKFILPYELSIELTDKCVMECVHCYKEASPTKSNFIDSGRLMTFLSETVGKVYSVQLTGGEAMLHPDFFSILEYCKKNFRDVRVSTTGVLINAQNVDRFRGTHVYLSLYSFEERQNNDYMRCAAFEKVIDAAKLLIEEGIHTCINTIASDRNIDQNPSFISSCENLGADGLGIGKVVRIGRGTALSKCDLCSSKCEEVVAKLDRDFYSPKMYLSTFVNPHMPKELHCGFYKWIIIETGAILPCAFFPAGLFKLGDLGDPIAQVFTQDKFEIMIKKLQKWSAELSKQLRSLEEICPALHLIDAHD